MTEQNGNGNGNGKRSTFGEDGPAPEFLDAIVEAISGVTPTPPGPTFGSYGLLHDLQHHVEEAMEGARNADMKRFHIHLMMIHDHLTNILPQIDSDVEFLGVGRAGQVIQKKWQNKE